MIKNLKLLKLKAKMEQTYKTLTFFIFFSTFNLPFVFPFIGSKREISDGSTKTLDLSRYHNYEAVHELFTRLERDYPDLARLYSIGQSVRNRELYVLRISSGMKQVPKTTPKQQETLKFPLNGKPMFK